MKKNKRLQIGEVQIDEVLKKLKEMGKKHGT